MFRQVFPQYLSIGMSREEFWDMDCTLAVAYREAYNLRLEQQNHAAWLQGMYFYEALCDVAPVLRAFVKSGTRPHKYSERPYDFMQKDREERRERRQIRKAYSYMESVAIAFNNGFKKRKAKEVTGDVGSADAVASDHR